MLTKVMPKTIIPLEILFEGENTVPWTIMFGISSKANSFFFFLDLQNMLDY